jgi:hypothetical protein
LQVRADKQQEAVANQLVHARAIGTLRLRAELAAQCIARIVQTRPKIGSRCRHLLRPLDRARLTLSRGLFRSGLQHLADANRLGNELSNMRPRSLS